MATGNASTLTYSTILQSIRYADIYTNVCVFRAYAILLGISMMQRNLMSPQGS